jgi:hypothetical protein
MRDHWNQATATLDIPTASPYAVSYFSLPKHYELAREVQSSRPAQNLLPGGSFELAGDIPKEGLAVDQLRGWSARFGTLDRVEVAAGVVPSEKLDDKVEEKKKPKELRIFAPSRPIVREADGYVPPAPELGRGVLKLEVREKVPLGKDGKPVVKTTHPLERTFLAVESPPVQLPPGSLVRVSGWVKVAGEIGLTADGALFYDDAGGEPLGVRLLSTKDHWQRFHLYRRVPASGQIALTVALTGIGVAYFDDLRVEPLVPVAQNNFGPPAPGATRVRPRVPATAVPSVQPTGGVSKW